MMINQRSQMNYIQLIKDIFKNNSKRTFIIESQTARRLSYEDFYNMAFRTAIDLRSKNIKKHDRVALLLNNSVEFAVLYFACLFVGAVAMPINTVLHSKDINFIISHSDPKIIVYSPSTKNVFDEITEWLGSIMVMIPLSETTLPYEVNRTIITENAFSVNEGWEPLDDVNDEDLFSIHFTSGTTNLPKGVPHRIGALMGNAFAFNNEYGITRNNRFLHVLPMSYMAGFLNTILSPFMAEASILLSRQFDAMSATRFWEPVIKYEADTFWLTPTILSILNKIDRSKKGPAYCKEKVSNIFIGTAALPLKTKDEFEKRYGIEVFESYGLSELLFVSANSKYNTRVKKSVGRILREVDIQICDEEGKSLPLGMDGEILLRTPFSTPGYLDYEASTTPSHTNKDKWFLTGDIGHIDRERNLFITARKKDLIIKGGLNISPRAIEETMLTHPDIELVAVVGIPNELQGEEVVAVIQLKSGRTREIAQPSIEDFCKKGLSLNATPSRYFFVDRLPMGSTGKVLKTEIIERLASKSNGDVE
jgi:long-chain acyl-CoA synthetase